MTNNQQPGENDIILGSQNKYFKQLDNFKSKTYLEFYDEKSHKFYEVTVTGTEVTVHYGPIGKAGRTTHKTYETTERAQLEALTTINFQLKKGYKMASKVQFLQPINDGFVEKYGGVKGIRFKVRNLKLNGVGNKLVVNKGERIEATLDIYHDCSECGGAINQIIVGIGGEETAQACVWIGGSSSNGWQTVSFSLNIPELAGTYYIRTRYAQAYTRQDALSWWKVDRPDGPTEEANIGAIIVKGGDLLEPPSQKGEWQLEPREYDLVLGSQPQHPQQSNHGEWQLEPREYDLVLGSQPQHPQQSNHGEWQLNLSQARFDQKCQVNAEALIVYAGGSAHLDLPPLGLLRSVKVIARSTCLTFSINLMSGENFAYHFNPRRNVGLVVQNTLIAGNWGLEERFSIPQDLVDETQFELNIEVEEAELVVFLNGKMLRRYKHRISPSFIDGVSLDCGHQYHLTSGSLQVMSVVAGF